MGGIFIGPRLGLWFHPEYLLISGDPVAEKNRLAVL
jgi:hypothetical protein